MTESPIFDEVLADSDPDIFLASNIFPNPTVEPTESLFDALGRIGHPNLSVEPLTREDYMEYRVRHVTTPPLQPAFTDWSYIRNVA